MRILQLKAKDCSPLGKLVLEYLEKEDITMTELADKAGLTRPGLRRMCLIRSNPTESSLIRLANAMGVHAGKLYQLAYQNKIENPYNPDVIDSFISGVNIVLSALREAAKEFPEEERLSDDELLETAVKTVKVGITKNRLLRDLGIFAIFALYSSMNV